jgi:hypothetical protein
MAREQTEGYCETCFQRIYLDRRDGAWVDDKGACGCGDGEHFPEPELTMDEH